MIKSVTLKNFKSIRSETFYFSDLDLIVGRNNSGKSTILQALAIWQYCIDEFHRTLKTTSKTGETGRQIVLPNFTALPVPEFNLLWTDRIDRKINEQKKQEYIYIEIAVEWRDLNGEIKNFGVKLRYQSSQSLYAIPDGGWKVFKALDSEGVFPRIVYVPPFSGLEPSEEWRDDGIIKKQVGKAQPGSILRNLLYRVVDKYDENGELLQTKKNVDWLEIERVVKEWFSLDITPPKYEKSVDTNILCEYKKPGVSKKFEIISGGSGFHQSLTLLAFLYGYEEVTTILFDEPDAHLHVSLQRDILDYFKRKCNERGVQFLIATHAEEFIRGVSIGSVVSILGGRPKRVESSPEIITALSDIANIEATNIMQSPYILYVEGESDERILRAWAGILGKEEILRRFYIKTMNGGSKIEMKKKADSHFNGLCQLAHDAKRLMIFDYDEAEKAFHPDIDNPILFEWKRKNIENYLLVPDTWKRAIHRKIGIDNDNLWTIQLSKIIDDFFISQNLTLPKNRNWQDVDADIFSVVNGKRILYEKNDALFYLIDKEAPDLKLSRDIVAASMIPTEIHMDISSLFDKLEMMIFTQE